MGEKRRSAVEPDHRVCGANLHRLGNFISCDARESLSCLYIARSSGISSIMPYQFSISRVERGEAERSKRGIGGVPSTR